SKLDRITAAGQSAIDFVVRCQAKFEERFRPRVRHVSFRQIAARPADSSSSDSLERGLADAFVSWTTVVPYSSRDEHLEHPAPAREDREFVKFGWRHFERTRNHR